MTITDRQRREVAARLREYDGKHGVETTWFGFNAADLIDRPTCRVESRLEWDTGDHGIDYELSCGHGATLGACDELRFCPECGAEVVE